MIAAAGVYEDVVSLNGGCEDHLIHQGGRNGPRVAQRISLIWTCARLGRAIRICAERGNLIKSVPLIAKTEKMVLRRIEVHGDSIQALILLLRPHSDVVRRSLLETRYRTRKRVQ